MPANLITLTANHLSPNNCFQPSTILKLYVGLGLDTIPPSPRISIIFESNFKNGSVFE